MQEPVITLSGGDVVLVLVVLVALVTSALATLVYQKVDVPKLGEIIVKEDLGFREPVEMLRTHKVLGKYISDNYVDHLDRPLIFNAEYDAKRAFVNEAQDLLTSMDIYYGGR